MIEDSELREVFKTANEEHLQKLDAGFLYLEENPDDLEKLEELLREAHSLKGDAGMLGVKDVSKLSHQLEHLLGEIKLGEQAMSPEINDRLSIELDAIRKLVEEVVTGESSGVNTVIATLMGSQNLNTQPQSEENITVTTPIKELRAAENDSSTSSMLKTEPDKSYLSSQSIQTSSTSYHIETVRVPTRNLDSLMTQTGELTVTQIRLAHQLG